MDPSTAWLFIYTSYKVGVTSALVTEAQCRGAMLAKQAYASVVCISPIGEAVYPGDLASRPLPDEAKKSVEDIVAERLSREAAAKRK